MRAPRHAGGRWHRTRREPNPGGGRRGRSPEVIRASRSLNPTLRVLARASYFRNVHPLKEAGANSAYSGEAEVALAFIEDLLAGLGATAERIDRERARTHDEMYSGTSFAESRRGPRP